MTGTVTLYTYWRSQAAFRVRIALRLKGLAIEKVTLDLLKGDQFAASYQALNPEGVVPTLIDGAGEPLVQSLAILEYLDEKYPDPPLLPTRAAGAGACARDRPDGRDGRASLHRAARAQISRGGAAASTRRRARRWVRHWLDAGSRAVEQVLARDPRTGRFCVGDRPTIADICLAAHLTSGKLFGGREPADYPTAGRIYAELHAARGVRRRASAAPAGRAEGIAQGDARSAHQFFVESRRSNASMRRCCCCTTVIRLATTFCVFTT